MTTGKGRALGSIFGAGARRQAPQPMPAQAAPPGVTAFLAVVDRLEAVLEAETEAVKRDLAADTAEIGNRKRQGLLEMERALRSVAACGPRPEVLERLEGFGRAVERNRSALGTQLRAAREIADIIAQTLVEAESDGTYSAMAGRA